MFILISCLTIFLLYLITERILLNRSLSRIPLRIVVTGTRGKSSVTRMLASVLTEAGKKVLAKTTGSEAVLLRPDGSQRELKRRGIPSIREQIGLVFKASRLGADCLVSEIMSIQPENHLFESQRILQPDVVVVTNIRLDHTEIMGDTEDEVASVLSLDIPPGATVFVPAQYNGAPFAEAVRLRGTLVQVPKGASAAIAEMDSHLVRTEFAENLDLVCEVARHLNISDKVILSGLLKTQYDVGRLRIWRACQDKTRSYYLVNSFAANDPESTFQVLERVLARLPAASDKVVGLLNLRADRGARTIQWIAALKQRGSRRFSKLFVTGSHSAVVRRHLPDAIVLKSGSAEAMTAIVSSGLPEGSVIFGFGNVKGAGLDFVNYWSKVGEDYGI